MRNISLCLVDTVYEDGVEVDPIHIQTELEQHLKDTVLLTRNYVQSCLGNMWYLDWLDQAKLFPITYTKLSRLWINGTCSLLDSFLKNVRFYPRLVSYTFHKKERIFYHDVNNDAAGYMPVLPGFQVLDQTNGSSQLYYYTKDVPFPTVVCILNLALPVERFDVDCIPNGYTLTAPHLGRQTKYTLTHTIDKDTGVRTETYQAGDVKLTAVYGQANSVFPTETSGTNVLQTTVLDTNGFPISTMSHGTREFRVELDKELVVYTNDRVVLRMEM